MSDKVLEPELENHVNTLINRYPQLKSVRQDIINAYFIMEECYEKASVDLPTPGAP